MPINSAPFPNTRWTLLQKLRDGSEADVNAALETLCKTYWMPLYAVARFENLSEHDAQDAVQGFFVTLLRRDTFARADATQGKLRNLLLRSFQNYCHTQWRKSRRQKRGDGAEHLPLHDLVGAEARIIKELQAPGLSLETLYNREWARTVLHCGLVSLRRSYEERGQAERFSLLSGPLTQEDDASTIDELACRSGMTTGSLRMALSRMRAEYRCHIERELSATLDTTDPAIIHHELMDLFQAFDESRK